MENLREPFDIGEIPGVDLTCGGRLHPREHQIANILQSDEDEIPRWQSLTKKAMHSAGFSFFSAIPQIWKIRKIVKQASAPDDTTVFCPANPNAEKVIMDFIGRFLKKESRIKGMENIAEAMELNAQGESVQFYSVPHQSALEPVFLKILLQREAAKTANGREKEAAEALIQQLVVLIGQKVLHNNFRRAFSMAVNGLFTVPPKYRANIGKDEKLLLTEHSSNIAIIIEYMRSDPRFAMFIFPEGGFTRDKQIGFQMMTAKVLPETHIVPIYTESPEGFLRPELGNDMHMSPSSVHVYAGKPFHLEEGSTATRISALVTTCRNNVRAMGAPIKTREWGYMKRDRNSDKGERFIPVI